MHKTLQVFTNMYKFNTNKFTSIKIFKNTYVKTTYVQTQIIEIVKLIKAWIKLHCSLIYAQLNNVHFTLTFMFFSFLVQNIV